MKTKYIIDSSAWIEYLGGTDKGVKFKEIIEQEFIASSIITIAEVADKFERENKKISEPLKFILGHAKIVSLDIDICLDAAKIKKEARKIHKKFSLADG
ncbi:PIN domain-containing protein, partial [archaeon]|nr:PIN domain-containing protein [archaeon]